MMKYWWFLGVVVLLVAAACAPAAAPPAPAPSAPPPAAPAAPKVSPEDEAWAKVVEAAKKEGRLTIYAATQFAGPKGQAVAAAFKERYGITVEILSAPGRQIEERISVEQKLGKGIADVMGTGTSSATIISQKGQAVTLWKELPEFRDKGVFLADPVFNAAGDVLSMVINLTGPMVNTKLVKPEDEPRSYNDFLKPIWKGKKIILSDPRGGGSGGFMWFSTMRAAGVLNDDYYRAFGKQDPEFWGGGSTEEYSRIARGENPVTVLAGTNSVGYMIVEGAPLKLLGMKEGNIAQGDMLTVSKSAPHSNAAKLFANWLFSPEGQAVYAQAGSMTSIRKDVPDFLDARVQLKPKAEKIILRTHELAEMTVKFHQDKVAEGIFGKK